MQTLPSFPRPHIATALTALVALAAAGLSSEAQAILPPNAAVSASVCSAASAYDARPTRSWGVLNYGAKGLSVTCPLNRPNSSPVYGVMVYGKAKPGEHLSCYLLNMRSQDGAMLGFKLFNVGNSAGGMPGVWVFLEPNERHADAVQEVNCHLPANGGGWLTAFEVFAG